MRVCLDTKVLASAVATRGLSPPIILTVRDVTDLPVLAEAVAGGADVLVTGDRDLLSVAAKAPIPILAPRILGAASLGIA